MAAPILDRRGRSVCRLAKRHTKAPTTYIAWHDWAEKKSKTHRQIKCPGCGLYKIWVPKKKRVKK
jgi:hypothetical protein